MVILVMQAPDCWFSVVDYSALVCCSWRLLVSQRVTGDIDHVAV
jgi:hypothetical protein